MCNTPIAVCKYIECIIAYLYFSHSPVHSFLPQRHLVINLLGLNDTSIFYENLKQRVSERICMSPERIESLGLLDETPVVKLNTPLDTLSYYLSKRLAFGKNLEIRY